MMILTPLLLHAIFKTNEECTRLGTPVAEWLQMHTNESQHHSPQVRPLFGADPSIKNCLTA